MSLNHLLHALSASLNLIIISITGSKFRQTLIERVWPKTEIEVDQIGNQNVNDKKDRDRLEAKNVTFEDKSGDIQCISTTSIQ